MSTICFDFCQLYQIIVKFIYNFCTITMHLYILLGSTSKNAGYLQQKQK